MDFRETFGPTTRKTHKPVKVTEWTDTSWDHADKWNDADCQALGVQICGLIVGTTVGTATTCSRAVQSNARRQHFNVRWAVNVEVLSWQQNEQEDGDKIWYDNCNNWNGNWVQNEMKEAHKIELTDAHRSWNKIICTHCRQIHPYTSFFSCGLHI